MAVALAIVVPVAIAVAAATGRSGARVRPLALLGPRAPGPRLVLDRRRALVAALARGDRRRLRSCVAGARAGPVVSLVPGDDWARRSGRRRWRVGASVLAAAIPTAIAARG